MRPWWGLGDKRWTNERMNKRTSRKKVSSERLMFKSLHSQAVAPLHKGGCQCIILHWTTANRKTQRTSKKNRLSSTAQTQMKFSFLAAREQRKWTVYVVMRSWIIGGDADVSEEASACSYTPRSDLSPAELWFNTTRWSLFSTTTSDYSNDPYTAPYSLTKVFDAAQDNTRSLLNHVQQTPGNNRRLWVTVQYSKYYRLQYRKVVLTSFWIRRRKTNNLQ